MANTRNSPACEGLKDSITFANMSQDTSTYDYCADWKTNSVRNCRACLRAGGNNYLANCKFSRSV